MANSTIGSVAVKQDATRIQGIDVDATPPTNGQVLAYDSGEDKYKPVAQSGGGGISLEPNQFKTLTFNAAPAVMEFGLEIGDGTDPVILTGGMNAQAIKEAIEASDDMAGFTVDVFGSTLATTGDDGVLLHSGKFIIAVGGTAPFPAWGETKNAEVQSFVVEDGDDGNYTLNGGASFKLSAFESAIQINQRALGGDYSDVIVKGASGGDEVDLTQGLGNLGGVSGWTNEANAFDNDPDTYASNGESGYSTYVEWDFGTPVELGAVIIDAYGYNYGMRGRGSNDNFATSTLFFQSDGSGQPSHWYAGRETKTFQGTGGNAYSKYRFYNGGSGGQVYSIQAMSVPGNYSGLYNSYFPFAVGNVDNPTCTGTDAVVSTLHEGGSTSSLVTTADATIEELLISGLISPESTAPTDTYTPGNAGHWANPKPTTKAAALDKLAAAFNDWIGPV